MSISQEGLRHKGKGLYETRDGRFVITQYIIGHQWRLCELSTGKEVARFNTLQEASFFLKKTLYNKKALQKL